MMHQRSKSLAVVVGLFAACGGNFANPVGTGASAVQLIGPEGGTLELEGARLTVPAGALRAATSLTVTSSTRAAPAAFESFSPVFVFGPEGTEFLVPARIELKSELPGGSKLVVYRTRRGSTTEFEAVRSTQVGGSVTAEVSHFSSGFIGEGRPGGAGGGSAGGGGASVGAGVGGGLSAGGGTAGGASGGDAAMDSGVTFDGGVDGGEDGGAGGGRPDAGFDGGVDGGREDGGFDGGTDGGFDGGRPDGGFDGGTDGGFDGGRPDGGFDAGTDGGFDAGTDGGFDGGTDGGFDGGTDGGFDGGTDGGAGSFCTTSSQCAPGLFCLGNTCS
jgi:hypothetical protein